jgi:hypothetical protein
LKLKYILFERFLAYVHTVRLFCAYALIIRGKERLGARLLWGKQGALIIRGKERLGARLLWGKQGGQFWTD